MSYQHTTDRGNKERWIKVIRSTLRCILCPVNGGENAGMNGRRPKSDRHKNHRRK